MAILETCNGIIKDGLCTKCYARQTSTSIRCVQVYEIPEPIKKLDTKLSPNLERTLELMEEAKKELLDYMNDSMLREKKN